MLVLTWNQPSRPPPCTILPKGEDRVTPKANKLACCPGLTNMGWLGCRGAAGADADEEDEDSDAPPWGVGWGVKGGGGLLGFGLFLPLQTGLKDQWSRLFRGDRCPAHLTQRVLSQAVLWGTRRPKCGMRVQSYVARRPAH